MVDSERVLAFETKEREMNQIFQGLSTGYASLCTLRPQCELNIDRILGACGPSFKLLSLPVDVVRWKVLRRLRNKKRWQKP